MAVVLEDDAIKNIWRSIFQDKSSFCDLLLKTIPKKPFLYTPVDVNTQVNILLVSTKFVSDFNLIQTITTTSSLQTTLGEPLVSTQKTLLLDLRKKLVMEHRNFIKNYYRHQHGTINNTLDNPVDSNTQETSINPIISTSLIGKDLDRLIYTYEEYCKELTKYYNLTKSNFLKLNIGIDVEDIFKSNRIYFEDVNLKTDYILNDNAKDVLLNSEIRLHQAGIFYWGLIANPIWLCHFPLQKQSPPIPLSSYTPNTTSTTPIPYPSFYHPHTHSLTNSSSINSIIPSFSNISINTNVPPYVPSFLSYNSSTGKVSRGNVYFTIGNDWKLSKLKDFKPENFNEYGPNLKTIQLLDKNLNELTSCLSFELGLIFYNLATLKYIKVAHILSDPNFTSSTDSINATKTLIKNVLSSYLTTMKLSRSHVENIPFNQTSILRGIIQEMKTKDNIDASPIYIPMQFIDGITKYFGQLSYYSILFNTSFKFPVTQFQKNDTKKTIIMLLENMASVLADSIKNEIDIFSLIIDESIDTTISKTTNWTCPYFGTNYFILSYFLLKIMKQIFVATLVYYKNSEEEDDDKNDGIFEQNNDNSDLNSNISVNVSTKYGISIGLIGKISHELHLFIKALSPPKQQSGLLSQVKTSLVNALSDNTNNNTPHRSENTTKNYFLKGLRTLVFKIGELHNELSKNNTVWNQVEPEITSNNCIKVINLLLLGKNSRFLFDISDTQQNIIKQTSLNMSKKDFIDQFSKLISNIEPNSQTNQIIKEKLNELLVLFSNSCQ